MRESPEKRTRPGIERLYAGIAKGEWDLIICEDSSRLYRNLPAAFELVGTAVDGKVRVICIGDDVDTAEDDWEERLTDAQNHHCRDNKFTRKRIARSFDDLWEMGAAIGPLRPGFRRTYTVAATATEPAEGPAYDELIPEWIPVIREAYERIADGEAPWSVARWLTEKGLPKVNGEPGPWNERNVITLIKSESYRAEEFHAKTKSVKKYVSDSSKQERSEDDERRHRTMPHRRAVSDDLWYRATKALRDRTTGGNHAQGVESPLYGVPRDSRGPLAKVLICDRCEHKMYQDGRNEGGYRCGNCEPRGDCWNKATALRDNVHRFLSAAICDAMMALTGAASEIVSYVKSLYLDEEGRKAELADCRARLRDREARVERLVRITEDKDDSPASVVEWIAELEQEVVEIRAELEELEHPSIDFAELTSEQVVGALNNTAAWLFDMEHSVGDLLASLIPNKIRAVPYLQFDTNNVVLKAECELHLVNFLPVYLRTALEGADLSGMSWADPVRICVNLFEPPLVCANAMAALALHEICSIQYWSSSAASFSCSGACSAIRMAQRASPLSTRITSPALEPVGLSEFCHSAIAAVASQARISKSTRTSMLVGLGIEAIAIRVNHA